MKTTILLVEDDPNLSRSIAELLVREGYQVTSCGDLSAARKKLDGGHSVVILDWMLPDGQGIDLLKEIRARDSLQPVMMLTARAELVDRIVGLESGANDYLVKPFEPRELLARVRVQLRLRAGVPSAVSAQQKSEILAGELNINTATRIARYSNHALELSKMEYELLRLLAENPRRVFSREELLNRVWGYENYPTTRTVDTHILQLRNKLRPELFESVRGIGYRFTPDATLNN